MEMLASSHASNQVRRLQCYSADGTLEICSIDWDRNDIRVDRHIASSDFFELTPEAAVEFRAALDEAIKVVNDSGHRWPILCCDSDGKLEVCSIETHQGTLRIGCGDADKPLWFFELRKKMIDQFCAAFDEALQGIETYNTKRDKDAITAGWQPNRIVVTGKCGTSSFCPVRRDSSRNNRTRLIFS